MTVGCKLLAADGRLISDTVGRTFLPKDVNPGDSTRVQMSLEFSNDLRAGAYSLHFDLVNELICWFADVSSEPPVVKAITVR